MAFLRAVPSGQSEHQDSVDERRIWQSDVRPEPSGLEAPEGNPDLFVLFLKLFSALNMNTCSRIVLGVNFEQYNTVQ